MQDIARRNDELLALKLTIDDGIAAKLVEHVPRRRHLRPTLTGIHQMEFVNFVAVIPKGQGVGVTVKVQAARRIQQKIADRLVGVGVPQDARQCRGGRARAGAG